MYDVHLGKDLHSEPDFDRVLLRIMHLFEEGEDPELSKPVTINLKVFLEYNSNFLLINVLDFHLFNFISFSTLISCVIRRCCRA